MKTRLLIIGIILFAVSITYVSFAYNQEIKLATGMMQSDSEPQPVNEDDSGWIFGEDYCHEWCDNDELYQMGCDTPILAHITKYSNLLDEEFDGTIYLNYIGLPDGVSVEKFDECFDFIFEKRISIDSESTYTLNEPHCFVNQVIYNDECVYVLIPADEFPKDMIKYFSMVDDVIINFCKIEITAISDGKNNSGSTIDTCFEISSYTISDVNVIEFQSTTPPTWINIRMENLTKYVELGSSPTFRVIESGWGSSCTSPILEVYHMKQEFGIEPPIDDLIYKHRIVYPCPFYMPTFPPPDVLRIWDESDFSDFPVCEEEGRYLIIGDSGYERHALDDYYCGIDNEN